MKKFLSVLMAVVMILSFAACGSNKESVTSLTLPGDGLTSLNAIVKAGFKTVNNQIIENVYAQTVENSKAQQFVVVVKVLPEQLDAFNAIDYFDEKALDKYLEVIGENQIEDILDTATVLPSKEQLDSYKGMTIADFEATGAWMSGYSGDNGQYGFNFTDDFCDYRVELEKGTKLKDLDDIDLFDNEIQDLKIGSIECEGITGMYISTYLSQFLDAPEKVCPKEMGEPKSSLDEINAAVGCSIKAASGATEEKFSVIDGKIAQYIYVLDDMYYCVRSSADTNINLADDSFEEYPLVDENGYVTNIGSTTDATNSIRFVFNNYQYAFIIYDNGEFDWTKVNELSNEFKNTVYSFKEGSIIKDLVGGYSADENYSMSIVPVSDELLQVAAFTYTQTETETEQKVWTMLVKLNGSKLTYDKSQLDVYKNGEQTSKNAGKGTITVKDGTLVWDKRTFTKVQ